MTDQPRADAADHPGEMTDRHIDPSRVPGAFMIEHCDIPVGMTLCEWRRESSARRAESDAAKPRRHPVRQGLARVLRRAA